MQIARIAQAMVGIALVLFTLAEYDSPILAGIVTFASVFPGLLASPIAGALLDRHGRVRLVILDYLVALASMVVLGILALAGNLPPIVLLGIAALSGLTSILSHTGLRSLFPLIVPKHLWERVNAVDSNGYIIATILGPPIAAAIVAFAGGPAALIVIGLGFGLAAVAMVGIPDPPPLARSGARLLADAWEGVRYTWRNPTLRGLGLSVATLNLAGGMTTIVVPLIVLDNLGYPEPVVGIVFALSGLSGMVSALIFGRMDTRGREWPLLVVPMVVMAPVVALMLPLASPDPRLGDIALGAAGGLALLAGSQILFGLLAGPLDVALFTVRQRRTDPALLGRAFAVSMAFNYLGYPVGAAVAGALAAGALDEAILLGVVASVLAAVVAAVMIPAHHEEST